MSDHIATWCEGCGPHEGMTCSECGYPIQVGVAVTDAMVERAMESLASTFGACSNHTARAALVAALSDHQATPDEPGRQVSE